MRRRDFFIAAGGAVAASMMLSCPDCGDQTKSVPGLTRKAFNIDEIPNYRRFHKRLREVLEGSDYDVLRWELEAPRDGFRLMRVFVKDGPPSDVEAAVGRRENVLHVFVCWPR
jgi:hypothetical protein